MNVVDALVAHHEVLRQLYRQAEENQDQFEEFIRHLIVHHTMEEKYFYDLLKKFGDAEHPSLEAVNEHHIIEMIIKDAEGFPRDHRHFPIKVEGLGEYTVHHLAEEEEEIFPLARQLFTAEELEILGDLFEKARKTLLEVSLPELPKKLSTKFNESGGNGRRSQEDSVSAGKDETARGLGIGKL